MMIVLLHCSTSWSKNDNDGVISSTVEAINDSVLIAYSDLRIANAKMTELKYEKEINKHLRTVIDNDSIAISNLNLRIVSLDSDYRRDIKRLKRERNILSITSFGLFTALIISLF